MGPPAYLISPATNSSTAPTTSAEPCPSSARRRRWPSTSNRPAIPVIPTATASPTSPGRFLRRPSTIAVWSNSISTATAPSTPHSPSPHPGPTTSRPPMSCPMASIASRPASRPGSATWSPPGAPSPSTPAAHRCSTARNRSFLPMGNAASPSRSPLFPHP